MKTGCDAGMQAKDDIELLREYTQSNSEEAFAALVARRMGMVYSVALRCVGNAHIAEEVTQSVFILLARKAATLRKDAISSWLFQTTRLTAANFVRRELRRQRREQEAYMDSLSDQQCASPDFSPVLDEALSKLATKDRHAVFLRFVEEKNCKQIAEVLGISEDAARVRVRRAIDKLRAFMLRRGVAASASAVVATIVSNSAQAAPTHLVPKVIATMALKGTAVGSSTSVLAKAALAALTWAKLNFGPVSAAALLVAASAVMLSVYRNADAIDDSVWDSVDRSIDALRQLPPMTVVRESVSGSAGMPETPVVITGAMKNGVLQQIICTTMKDANGAIGGMALGLPQGLNLNSKGIGKDLSARALLATAYGITEFDLRTPLPELRLNYIVTTSENPRLALQAEVQKTLGLTCRVENRLANVWSLRVKKPNGSGLVVCSHAHCNGIAAELANFCWAFERALKAPVINETGLKGGVHISSDLNYTPGRLVAEGDSAKRAVLDELGFELVSCSRSVPVLVVEKAAL